MNASFGGFQRIQGSLHNNFFNRCADPIYFLMSYGFGQTDPFRPHFAKKYTFGFCPFDPKTCENGIKNFKNGLKNARNKFFDQLLSA